MCDVVVSCRLAALLYQRNKKYALAIELSKKDAQLQDCIDTAKESGSAQLVEDLLKSGVSLHVSSSASPSSLIPPFFQA